MIALDRTFGRCVSGAIWRMSILGTLVSARLEHGDRRALLEAAATRESRSQTNMLEALLFQHRSAHGIDIAPTAAQACSTVKCE